MNIEHEVKETQKKRLEHFDAIVLDLFAIAERVLLLLIGALATLAVAFELRQFIGEGNISLADLLLLFIYLEVIGMAYAYYATHSVPITLPVLIAITGVTRLTILQGKDFEPTILVYEGGAVLLLAISYGVLTWASETAKKK